MDWILNQVLTPILVIGVLVFIHEFGHFIVAKACGVGVLKFSIGFGPAIWKIRRAETEYQVSIIPLGGYVRMVGDIPDGITGEQPTDHAVRGEEEEEELVEEEELPPEVRAAIDDPSRWFINKNLWQRSSIVAAGPLFNFFLAIFLSGLAVFIYGEQELNDIPQISEVMQNSPAAKSGIQSGDLVLSVDGEEISTWTELAQTIHDGDGQAVNFLVSRGEEEIVVVVTPEEKSLQLPTGEKQSAFFVGISPGTKLKEASLFRAVYFGLVWTADKTALTCMGLWGMLTGKVSAKDLAGPVFIIDAAGQQAKEGLGNVMFFTALLSVSLAVLNLLPIPVLDGGHLMFFAFEAIFGGISIRKKEIAQQIGMVLLLSLMVFAVVNDFTRDPKSFSAGQLSWDEEEDSETGESPTSDINRLEEGGEPSDVRP